MKVWRVLFIFVLFFSFGIISRTGYSWAGSQPAQTPSFQETEKEKKKEEKKEEPKEQKKPIVITDEDLKKYKDTEDSTTQSPKNKQSDDKNSSKKPIVITDEDLKKYKDIVITTVERDDTNSSTSSSTNKSNQTNQNQNSKAQNKKTDDSLDSPVDLGSDNPRYTEKYWKNRRAAIDQNIRITQDKLQTLEKKFYIAQQEYFACDIISERVEKEKKKDQLYDEIQVIKQRLVDYQQDIIKLKREARRAGVPIGWVR